MTKLQETIRNLQLNNKLVILRCCGGEEREDLVASLAYGYNIVDLSLPDVRMQVKQDTQAFMRALGLPAYLRNLHCEPALLGYLLQSELPLGKVMADCVQNYYLQTFAERVSDKVCFWELPQSGLVEQVPFLSDADFFARSSAKKAGVDVLAAIIHGGFGADGGKVAAFISRVLRRNIMEQTTVSDEIRFFNFLCAAAGMAGGIVNYAILANSVGISAPTAKQWLQFLVGTGIAYFLQPLEGVSGKRLLKAPKLYFKDTAIAAYLLQIHNTASLTASLYFKALYENYVVNLIRESYLQQGVQPNILFYRDSNNKEISAVIRWRNELHPVLISRTGLSARKLTKLFSVLLSYAQASGLQLGVGCQIVLGGQCTMLANNVWQIDAGKL